VNAARPVFISFHTPNGNYPGLAVQLRRSLERFALEHDIHCVPSFADWSQGCRFKSSFILQMLFKHRRPVVWMDVDTEVVNYPELLFGPEDFAIYNWFADSNHHLEEAIGRGEYSGSLLCSGGVQKWGYTAPALELLMRWIAGFATHDWKRGDDLVLDAVFSQHRPPVRPLWLPKTYNRMAGLSPHWACLPQHQVVIEHHYQQGRHRDGALAERAGSAVQGAPA
jgi:hypothetical protein